MQDLSSLDLILISLLGLFLLAIAAAVVLALLVRKWRNQAETGLLQLGSELNTFVNQIDALQTVREEYGALRRQPYNDLSGELQRKINQLSQSTHTLEVQWNQLNHAHNQTRLSAPQNVLDQIPRAQRNAALAARMWQLHGRIAEEIKDAQALAGRIESLPEEIHSQARQVAQTGQELATLLSDLHAAGLHGPSLDQANDALLRLQQGLARLPADFTGENPPDLQKSQVREAASSAFTLLSDVQPAIEAWLPQARAWEQQYSRTVDSYEHMRKDATNFRKALNGPPPGLAVETYLAELDKIRQAAMALNQRLQKPAVEELRALEKEAARLEKVVQDASKRYEVSAKDAAELDRALLEMDAQFEQISKQLAEPEQMQVFPLRWDITRPALNHLAERAAQLGGRDRLRNPKQVTDTLRAAAALRDEAAKLSGTAEATLNQHRELLSTLGVGAIAGGHSFISEAQVLARTAQPYDPANWGSQFNLANFSRDILLLEEQQRRLTRVEQPSLVDESGLAARLADARQLAELHTRMRSQVQALGARLEDLKSIETEQRDELQKAASALDGLAKLFRDNPYMQEQAGEDLRRLQMDVQSLQAEINNPREGILEKKALRAKALLDLIARKETGWLDKLIGNLQIYTQSIRDTLDSLAPIATLDERAVAEGQALLKRIGPNPANRKANLTYLDAAAELKRWSNEWQSAAATAKALDDLAEPIQAAWQEVEEARKSARAAFQAAGRMASGRRDWPPTREALPEDIRAYQELEKRLDGLKTHSIPAVGVVRVLDQIARELDRLEDHAGQSIRQAEVEQAAASQLESEVETFTQQWQAIAQSQAGRAEVTQQVNAMVRQADQSLAQLKNRYKRGNLTYDQALNQLQELSNHLRNAHVRTADGEELLLD